MAQWWYILRQNVSSSNPTNTARVGHTWFSKWGLQADIQERSLPSADRRLPSSPKKKRLKIGPILLIWQTKTGLQRINSPHNSKTNLQDKIPTSNRTIIKKVIKSPNLENHIAFQHFPRFLFYYNNPIFCSSHVDQQTT